MLDEIVERAVPWGGLAALGVLAGAAFPKETRRAAKAVIKTGFRLGEVAGALAAEAYEKGQDIVAEARAEQLAAERESARSQLRVVPARARRTARGGSAGRTRATRARRSTTPPASASAPSE